MKMISMTLPDRSEWGVPVEIIARHHAAAYASEFDGDIERSLNEGTLPLFEADHFAITDWAVGNMNWSDVSAFAGKLKEPDLDEEDFQEAWMTAEKKIVDHHQERGDHPDAYAC